MINKLDKRLTEVMTNNKGNSAPKKINQQMTSDKDYHFNIDESMVYCDDSVPKFMWRY